MKFNNRTSSRFDPEILIIGFVIALIVLVAGGGGIINATHTETHKACLVTDKDRTSVSTGSDGGTKSDARVYTENCGTFQVADSVLSWTFSSADTFGSIREGHTYNFKTRGYRIPIFSSFSNIVEVTEVK